MDAHTKDSHKPEDQRVRITKAMLQSALIDILREKPVQSITVKELCQRAGVNRGTFYLHYRDIYALMEQMEATMLSEIDALLSQNPVIVSGEAPETSSIFVSSIFEFFEKNREMCAILLGPNGDKNFLAAIIERGRDKSVREYRERFPGVTRQRAETFYYFIAWGFIGLIQYSLQNPGALTPEQLAYNAQLIVEGGAQVFEAGDH